MHCAISPKRRSAESRRIATMMAHVQPQVVTEAMIR